MIPPRVYPAALNYFTGRSFPRTRACRGTSPGNSTKRVAGYSGRLSPLLYRLTSFFLLRLSFPSLPFLLFQLATPGRLSCLDAGERDPANVTSARTYSRRETRNTVIGEEYGITGTAASCRRENGAKILDWEKLSLSHRMLFSHSAARPRSNGAGWLRKVIGRSRGIGNAKDGPFFLRGNESVK